MRTYRNTLVVEHDSTLLVSLWLPKLSLLRDYAHPTLVKLPDFKYNSSTSIPVHTDRATKTFLEGAQTDYEYEPYISRDGVPKLRITGVAVYTPGKLGYDFDDFIERWKSQMKATPSIEEDSDSASDPQ